MKVKYWYSFFKEYNIIPLLVLVSPWVVPKEIRSWVYYVFFCIGFFWFGSTSFTQYDPMPLMDRMVLPALPGMYILAAYVISKVDLSSSRLVFGSYIIPVILVLALTIYPFARYVKYLQTKDFSESHAVGYFKIYTQEDDNLQYLLLCSDQRSAKYLKIYFSYNYPKNLKVMTLGKLDDNLLQNHKVLILTPFGLSDPDDNPIEDIIKIFNYCIYKYGHYFTNIIISVPETFSPDIYEIFNEDIIKPQKITEEIDNKYNSMSLHSKLATK